VFGTYTYVVTPRYFTDAGALTPLDPHARVSLDIDVGPFVTGALTVAFTRGYVQSQAFVRHFGDEVHIRPDSTGLVFDTSATAGSNRDGQSYTYAQEYDWLGFTARRAIFDLLDKVVADPALTMDVFAYDLDEPDIVSALLTLGEQHRVRIILDSAALHTGTAAKPSPEDTFTQIHRPRRQRRRDQTTQVRALRPRQGVHRLQCHRAAHRADGLDQLLGQRHVRQRQPRVGVR
jgi:hypothetical protein